jgi:hypothetical protein
VSATNKTLIRNETKIFDPADGFGAIANLAEITDATLAKRGDRWWLFGAGQTTEHMGTELFSASLPAGAPLSATGWLLTPGEKDAKKIALLADHDSSKSWDLKGGRHCPSYVRGWNPQEGKFVERIYYAGSAENLWGPYTIGYLEWDGSRWVDQPEPVLVGKESWEHGSVYEPNLIYAEGKWKMWYVAGSNQEDYIVQGFVESEDGKSGWSEQRIFAPAEEKMFDFSVTETDQGYEAVFSKVWLRDGETPSQTGLWWCEADAPSSNLSDWSKPVQIMTAEPRGWHAGPWKPSLRYSENDADRMFVFFDGIYKTSDPGPFPFAFTLGCLETERPE